jgi:hypothetical protein
MNPEKIWLVIVLVIIIVVLSNLLVLAAARGFGRGEIKWFKKNSQPLDFFKGDKEAEELSERMNKLRQKDEDTS